MGGVAGTLEVARRHKGAKAENRREVEAGGGRREAEGGRRERGAGWGGAARESGAG